MKALIIHHNDDDGIAAAGVAALYLKRANPDVGIDYISADYVQPLSELVSDRNMSEYSGMVMVDYSISTEENAKFVLDISEHANGHMPVVWIDHHKSSIDMEKEYPSLKNISGFRIVGIAGVLLTWFFCDANFSSIYYNELLNYHNEGTPISMDILDDIITNSRIPKTLVAIHKYDIWDHRDPEIKLFHFGYHISRPEEIFPVINSPYCDFSTYSGSVEDGRTIKDYIDIQNKEYRDRCGFETTIYDKSNDRTYNVFALNTDRATSLTFGEKMDQYDICMPFFYNGKKQAWVYSLYTNKDDVDCSLIAKALGGGGHAKAAGFSRKCFDTTFTI